MSRRPKQFTKNTKAPTRLNDFRKVMERSDMDVISQATPDHWHTLVNLAAAKPKKDVYSEKPLTLTLDEGKRLVQTVRENKVILQTHSQQRSDQHFRLACELVRNGPISPSATGSVRFEGSDGWIWVTRGELKVSDDALLTTPLSESAIHLEVSGDHMGNFFDCVRSRQDPICHVEVGYRSVSVCHLGVIALRVARPLRWDPVQESFVGDNANEANAYVTRSMRHPYDYSFI